MVCRNLFPKGEIGRIIEPMPTKVARLPEGGEAGGLVLIPDRYEGLSNNDRESNINTIIVPVNDALNLIDNIYVDMTSAGRGAFLILRGWSGSGKSTFLHTIHLFRESVEIISIDSTGSVANTINTFKETNCKLRIIIIENREALIDFSPKDLEKDLHSINRFLRTANGRKTIIVWPCNTLEMEEHLVKLSKNIGGEALVGHKGYFFPGPPKEEFFIIAKRTVHLLNEGASLLDLGVDEEYAHKLAYESETIGSYLGNLRKALNTNKNYVSKLLKKEQCRMWVVVIAGNEPENDVAALTRGRFASADVDRLLGSTGANIVADLKAYPEKLGILATVFDCKIIYLPILTALAISRDFADFPLLAEMEANNLKVNPDNTSKERLLNSEIAYALTNQPSGPRSRGTKTGSNSKEAFEKLSNIASSNDRMLNMALAAALKSCNLINGFTLEQNLGNGLTRRTDILCDTPNGILRLEIMWRKKASRGDIANYVLNKLYNYGRAIGFLES